MHALRTGHLHIETLIEDDGNQSFTFEVSDDMTYVQALGLLEAVKLSIAATYDDED